MASEVNKLYKKLIEQWASDTLFYDIENKYYFYQIEDKLFEHYIGSKLLGTETELSDTDTLSIHSYSRILKSNSLHERYYDYEKVATCTGDKDKTYYSGSLIIKTLVDPQYSGIDQLSKIVSHLAAIKFNHDSLKIYNQDVYKEYVEYLNTPGKSTVWWQYLKNKLYTYYSMLPDCEFNWPRNVDVMEKYKKTKDKWLTFSFLYPNVQDCGYDPKISAYVFKDLIIAKNILSNKNEIISSEDKEILISLKKGKCNFTDYSKYKKYLWSEFRKATETPNQVYFLGSGNDFLGTKKTKYFGSNGDKKILKIFETETNED
jgi:hypothetical protein